MDLKEKIDKKVNKLKPGEKVICKICEKELSCEDHKSVNVLTEVCENCWKSI